MREEAPVRRSVHGQVVEELGRRIVAGAFPPGSVLPTEGDYAARLAVSRTSFREAIKTLAGKGLVESRPKTGTRVRPRSAWNMLDPDVAAWSFDAGPGSEVAHMLFEFRQVIEPAAAALAARRRGEEALAVMRESLDAMAAAEEAETWVEPDLVFHRTILESTQNDLLVSIGHLIEPALARSFAMSNIDRDNRKTSLPLHERVFDAIAAADAEGARAAMTRLLSAALGDLELAIAALRQRETKG